MTITRVLPLEEKVELEAGEACELLGRIDADASSRTVTVIFSLQSRTDKKSLFNVRYSGAGDTTLKWEDFVLGAAAKIMLCIATRFTMATTNEISAC